MSKFVLFIALILGISGIIVCVRLPPVKAVDIIWKEGHITADETWFYIPNTIYRVIGDVYVDPGVKLTIEPNVTIQFADGFSLIVDGSLNATGTGSESIVFTSSRTSPSAGAWNTVMFRGNSGEEFLLKHVRLMYAANGVTVEGTTSARIETSEVFNCSTGLRLRGQSNVFIEHNKLMHNGVGVASEASFSGNIEAMNNTIVENENYGVYVYPPSEIHNMVFMSNNISANKGYGLYLYVHDSAHDIVFLSNTISSNLGGGLWLTVPSIENAVISHNKVSFNGGNGLFLDAYWSIHTNLIHNVTLLNNMIFSNGENGIYIYNHGGHTYDVDLLNNTIYSNANNGVYADSNWIYNFTLLNNTFLSNDDGIYIIGSFHNVDVIYDLNIACNTVSANRDSGIEISGSITSYVHNNSIANNRYGVLYRNGHNMATYNDIFGNEYGMNVVGGATADAEYNYWGDPTGPYHPSINPEGKGNPVNGDGIILDFVPWGLEWYVPEFPTFLILPLFMIATLLAVIVYKRKHALTLDRG